MYHPYNEQKNIKNAANSILGMYLFGGKFCKFTDELSGQERECTCPEIISKHPHCECDRKHFNNILWVRLFIFHILLLFKKFKFFPAKISNVIYSIWMFDCKKNINKTNRRPSQCFRWETHFNFFVFCLSLYRYGFLCLSVTVVVSLNFCIKNLFSLFQF